MTFGAAVNGLGQQLAGRLGRPLGRYWIRKDAERLNSLDAVERPQLE